MTRKLDLAKTTDEKWDSLNDSYNRIVDRINEISCNHHLQTAAFRTTDGTAINLNEFNEKMLTLHYKLRYACVSLEYLRNVYRQFSDTLDKAMKAMTESISEDFIFHTDVFFIFGYSAFDIVAGILDMMTQTGLQKKEVNFYNVIEALASSNYSDTHPIFRTLKQENKTGWIREFRRYRVFLVHYSTMRLQKEFKYTARDQTIEINFFLLPDDPEKRPYEYNSKRELVPYCEKVMEKELDAIKELFDFTRTLI